VSDRSLWKPTSSADAYDARWQAMAAKGEDPHGEVGFLMTLQPRSVLDAGCGTGRVAIELARRGIEAVGTDIDAGMLAVARRKAPDIAWHEADLATLDIGRTFDVVAMAGNVILFVVPTDRASAVRGAAQHLEAGGHLVAGFQLGRDVDLADYDDWATAAGLDLVGRYATWQAEPFSQGVADYAVSVHRRRPA
jgi:SAM-dependent methyltransferase